MTNLCRIFTVAKTVHRIHNERTNKNRRLTDMVIGPTEKDWILERSSRMSDNLKISAVAGEDILPGTISWPMTTTDPLNVHNVFWNDSDLDYIIEITVKDGKMTSSALSDSWMKHVRFARHCHMQNLQLIYEKGVFCFQATQLIRKGETLYVWFTMETSKYFKIPFLTLKNIKGGHHYSCHACNAVYADPNPLKVHLACLCPSKIDINEENPWQEQPFTSQLTKSPIDKLQANETSSVTSVKHNTKPVLDFLYLAASGPSLLPQFPKSKFPSIFSNRSAFKPLKRTLMQSFSSSPLTTNTNSSSSLSSELPSFLSASTSSAGSSTRLVTSETHTPSCKSFSLSTNSKLQSTQSKSCGYSTLQPFRSSGYPTECFDTSYFYLSSVGERTTPQSTRHHANEAKYTARFPGLEIIRNDTIPTVSSSTNDDGEDHDNGVQNKILINSIVSSERPDNPASISGIISEQFLNADGKPKRRHKCYYCGKMYSRKYGLKIHIRTHTGYKPLKCKVCLRPFGDPSNLNKHIRLHAEGITPYRCELCGKVLVRRRDLERHLKSRHPNHTAVQQVSTTNSFLKVNDNSETH